MNQYFTGFISAVILTTSFFLFVGAKKRKIDNLTVQKITIVDNAGNQVGEIGSDRMDSYFWLKSLKSKKAGIELSSKRKGSSLVLRNFKGKEIVNVGIDRDNEGSFLLNDRNGVSSLRMSSLSQGGGGMTFFNLRGKETVFIGTNKINGGQVKTYNGLGSETIFLGTDQNDAGLLSVNNNIGSSRAVVGVDQSGKGVVNTLVK